MGEQREAMSSLKTGDFELDFAIAYRDSLIAIAAAQANRGHWAELALTAARLCAADAEVSAAMRRFEERKK